MTDLLTGLNPQQRKAVTAGPGPVLVLAGPGSGKTRVLTHRTAWLVRELGVPPYRIMAVTFTNKAAREMRGRVEKLLAGKMKGLTVGTFHSICARILRREADHLPVTRDFVIYDETDQRALVKQALHNLNLDEKQYQPPAMLGAIGKAKNELIGPDDYPSPTYFHEVVRRVYRRYQVLLAQNNALDFDDLLMDLVKLFQAHPEVLAKYQQQYEHILVDEFQDTNTAQYVLLRHLTQVRQNLYCVGDQDQSIYRFRGADYRNVRRFQEDYPTALTILLEQNYRSTQVILDAAMAVIDRNPNRIRKSLFTERGGGVKVFAHEAYDEAGEAQFVVESIATLVAAGEAAPGDCAIMYRTNAQSRALEEAFLRANLPYKLVGAQRFYGRREIKDIIAYLRLVHNPADSVSLARVLNVPPRGIGAKTLSALADTVQSAGMGWGEALLDLAQKKKESRFVSVFGGRAASALAGFGELLRDWMAVKDESTVLELMDRILADVAYQSFIDDGTEEGAERWENVMELRRVAREFEPVGLTSFLEELALVSDQDTLTEDAKAPTLLTLHAAKGLEFPVVFITGLDDGVFPHQRSMDDPEQMAEERRLMYVGLTRAKDRLYLVRAFRRSLYGSSDVAVPSRFLEDIPADLMEGKLIRRQSRDEARYRRITSWETSVAPAARLVETEYYTGMRVNHPSWGEGLVIESRLVGGDEEVVVAFESVGLKRLAASLANLQLIE